jgi:AraC family transcriptional regulator
MQPILASVAARLDEDISLAALAREAHLSPFHLQRIFAAAVGETPKQLTIRLRLGRAAVLLLATRESVLDIALGCGFQSHEAFTRAFRRRFGIAPSAYRARGFVNTTDLAAARNHAALVENVAPCVGLYRMTEQKTRTNPVTYSITTKQIEPQPVLVVRRQIKREEIAATIQAGLHAIFLYAQSHGVALAHAAPFSRYIAMGPGLITMEPGVHTAGPHETVANDAGVTAETLPGGRVATTIHQGPYDQLSEAWTAMHQSLVAEGLRPGDAPWESYITDPGEVPDPKDWKTELFWPLTD